MQYIEYYKPINKNLMDRFFSLLGGVALGALLGILFAPKSGKETREEIKKLLQEKCPDLDKERLETLVDEVIAKMKSAYAEDTQSSEA